MPLFFLALALQCSTPEAVRLEDAELVHPVGMSAQECADMADSAAIRESWLPVADSARQDCEAVLICVRMDFSRK